MTSHFTGLPLIVLAWLLIAIAQPVYAQQSRNERSRNDQTPVATLVKRLGSDDFIERQSASKLLFEKGPGILDELAAVPLSSNPELNQRVSDLTKLLALAPEAINHKETYDAVVNFEHAELETRKQLLEKLLSGQQYEMYFRMIESLPPDQAEDVFSENRLRYLIPVLCEKGNWNDVDAILSHRLTWKYEPKLCGLYHKTMGTLDVQIDVMKRAIDEAEFADPIQLATLIGFLKSEKEYTTALRYAKRFGNADLINAYENQILMESGDWKTLADRAVLNDQPIETDHFFLCNRLTYPLVKYWGGTKEEFEAALEKVTEKSIDRKDGEGGDEEEIEGFGDDLDRGEAFTVDPILQQIHLLTLNWEEAQKGIAFTENQSTVTIFSVLNQYDQLLKELTIGTDFESHQKWAAEKQADIKKLTRKFSTSGVRNNQTRRKDLIAEVNMKLRYYLDICDLFAELGLEKEAILFVRQLYQHMYPIQEMATSRLDLIGRVADYGDADALWDFIENAGLTNDQLKWLVDTRRPLGALTEDKQYVLFGFKHDVAQFVFQKLSPKVDDRITLLKHIAYVVNYQLKPRDIPSLDGVGETVGRFSLDADVALIEHSFGSDECWKISQIYAYHQRPEFKQWRQRAAINGDTRAIKQIANELFDAKDYRAAAAMFEQEHKRTMSPLPLSRAAEAYGLAGDSLKERRLSFYAYVLPDFIYDNNYLETYGAYLEDERADLIAERLHYRISTSQLSSQNYLIGYGWRIFENPDPVAASNCVKMQVLSSNSSNTPLRLMSLGITAHTIGATAAVVKGNYQLADRFVNRLLDFSPATPSVAEKTVVQLDLAGQREIADRVIERLANFYHQLLAQYPTSSTHSNNYAWVLACGRRHADAAVRRATIAVDRRPNSPGFIDTLAESYFAAGDIEKAIATINIAAAIEPQKAYYVKQRQKYEASR